MPGVSQPLSLQSPSSSTPGVIRVNVANPGNTNPCRPATVDNAINAGAYATIPNLWTPLSGKPAWRLTATNNALTASVALCVCDRYTSPVLNQKRSSIWAEPWTVHPGETEIVAFKGMAKTIIYVVAWVLSVDDSEIGGAFTVNVSADNVAG